MVMLRVRHPKAGVQQEEELAAMGRLGVLHSLDRLEVPGSQLGRGAG